MTSLEKIQHFMKKPKMMLLYLIALIFIYHFIDKPVALYFHHLDWRSKAPYLQIFAILGKNLIYIALFLILGLWFRYLKNERYEARTWYLLMLIVVLAAFNLSIKIILGRARPELLFLNQEYGFFWFKLQNKYWSFPSGHTTTMVALLFGLSQIFPRLFFSVLCISLLVMLSRIVSCNHYISDVMAAFYLHIIVAGLLTEMLKKNKYTQEILKKM